MDTTDLDTTTTTDTTTTDQDDTTTITDLDSTQIWTLLLRDIYWHLLTVLYAVRFESDTVLGFILTLVYNEAITNPCIDLHCIESWN